VTTAPTGRQIVLTAGADRAAVTEVGASLREFTVAGRDVVVSFPEDALPPASNGAVLVPWPNRIADGRYTWDGVEYQLPITEPARATALHGLVCWERWDVEQRDDASATLSLDTVPVPGYPFPLHVAVTYALDGDGGLAVTVTTTATGSAPAPYGVGFHPWLSPGPGSLDDAVLQLDVEAWVPTDDRLLPTGVAPVPDHFDFRSPRALGSTDLDDAFLEPGRDDDGLAWLRLRGSDGRTAAVWMDDTLTCWQMCTGDHVSHPAARRTGLAAEPMTCIADAFRTGDLLIRLEPGVPHTVRWGLALQ
jgi:aldose 1-epimerase